MSRRRVLRVIYQNAEGRRELGALSGDFLHASSLDPFVSKLLQEGVRSGTVSLIDEETGERVTKRSIAPVRSGATRMKSA